MKTVGQSQTSSYRENGSKFIGFLLPAASITDFEDQLEQIVSRYPDATHHCYAYRINPIQLQEFAQDDGEPSGTAGLPILNQLKSAKLVNCGVVVVRYYGGTKLGKSGLIQAYGHTAATCIKQASLYPIQRTLNIELQYPYHRQNEIDRLKSSFELIETDAEYLADITLEVACPLPKAEELCNRLDQLKHLDITYEVLGKDFVVRRQP